MKAIIGGALAFIAGILIIIGVGWGLSLNDLALRSYFAPRQEAIRRQTFEQSKAYNQGMIQELQNMQFQYEQASPEHQAALRSIILHRAADYPEEAMPPALAAFVSQLRRSR